MNEKVIGYSLLTVGLLGILIPLFSVIQVFTGRAEPIQIFDFPPISLSATDLIGGGSPETGEAIKQLSGGEVPEAELVSSDILNDPSNLFAHLMLMGFIASAGQKIASLGVSLIRPIVIKAKTENGSKKN